MMCLNFISIFKVNDLFLYSIRTSEEIRFVASDPVSQGAVRSLTLQFEKIRLVGMRTGRVIAMKIDVFQDTVCPWCRIGKAHLMQALEQLSIEPLEIHYRAFLLDPTTPIEGNPRSALVERLGGKERSDEMHNHLCQVGEACGLEFNFENIEQIPNTLLSHQLIKLAPHDKQQAIVEALHDAYFEHGRDIGQLDVLLDIAKTHGMDVSDVETRLRSQEKLPEVENDLAFAQAASISGVPFFVVNDQYALSGAQPIEVFVQALKQIDEEQ